MLLTASLKAYLQYSLPIVEDLSKYDLEVQFELAVCP